MLSILMLLVSAASILAIGAVVTGDGQPNAGAGGGGDGTGGGSDGSDDAEPPKYTERQMQEAIQNRLRNLKAKNAKLEAELVEVKKRPAQAAPPPDEGEEPAEDEPAAPAAASPREPSVARRLAELAKLRKDREAWENERKTLTQRLAESDEAHKATRIKHAALDDLSKRPDVVGTSDILDLAAKHLTVNDEGKVVAVDADGGETPLEAFFDAWLKAHPNFVRAPSGGPGDRPGQRATRGGKAPAEMTEGEAYRAGVLAHFGPRK